MYELKVKIKWWLSNWEIRARLKKRVLALSQDTNQAMVKSYFVDNQVIISYEKGDFWIESVNLVYMMREIQSHGIMKFRSMQWRRCKLSVDGNWWNDI
jgi:hypothetical protein